MSCVIVAVMGYTTTFEGSFTISPPLTPEQVQYLNLFSSSRRMKRDPEIARKLPDPAREGVGLPIGYEAEFFVGGTGYAGQDRDASVLDYNYPPCTQPSLWCQWIVSPDGSQLYWDKNEKFYSYVSWLQYLIMYMFHRWGRTLNGTVTYQGEGDVDYGEITIVDNKITVTGPTYGER